MPPPARSKPIRKDKFSSTYTNQKAVLFSETQRPSSLAPHIRHLSWSPTGLALSSTNGAKIRIWNPDNPGLKNSQELSGHTGSVERVEWNPTREGELASTGQDGTVRLWDVRVGAGAVGHAGQAGRSACVKEAQVGDAGLFLAWHPGGQQMVVGRRDDVIVVVDVRKGVLGTAEEMGVQERGKLGSGQTNQCAFSNSGRELFATTSEGTVKVLDWPSMSLLHTLPAHTSAAYSVQHSPHGSFLAVGGGDSLITLWDTSDWVCKHTLSSLTGGVHCVSFSFDGTYIVGAHGPDKDGEKGIEVACAQTGEYLHTIETVNVVNVVAWHPLRYWIAYAGDPGGVKMLGVGPGNVL